MYAEDRDALICDMAQTYHILDVHAIPVSLFATLASGLREDSRVKMKLADRTYIPPEAGIFAIHDILAQVFSTKHAKPVMLMKTWQGGGKKKEGRGFSSAAEFEAFRQRMMKGNSNV